MPYEIRGNTVVKKDTGKVVGHSKNPEAYLKALYAHSKGVDEHSPCKFKRREGTA
jgi:shikimate 5-dehydrogenase